MDTTIDALKNLYVALGGDVDDVENITIIPDMINAIAEIAGSTLELPKVKTADNGSVLTVVSGKWAKAAIPSQLPAVDVSDAGAVLKVNAEGAWDKGTDNIE